MCTENVQKKYRKMTEIFIHYRHPPNSTANTPESYSNNRRLVDTPTWYNHDILSLTNVCC